MNTITGLVITDSNNIVPEDTIRRWETILELLAQVFNVPVALVMKVHKTEIEVFLHNQHQDNPYSKGEKTPLANNLYCDTVMRTDEMLHVPNALEDPEWKDNPDVELNMISYLGVPLHWPGGELFGTVCVLDSKTNQYSDVFKELLIQFRDSMENDLELYKTIYDLTKANKELKELRGLIPICASCKNVRDDSGYWNQIETYLSHHSNARFTHGICPECEAKLYSDIRNKYPD